MAAACATALSGVHKKQKLNSGATLTCIDFLTERLEKVRDQLNSSMQVENDVVDQEVAQKLAQVEEEGQASLEDVASANKAFHEAVSRMCKSVEKNIGGDVEFIKSAGELPSPTLNSVVAAHLYRRGAFNAAEALVKEAGVELPKEQILPMSEVHKVITGLREKNLGPAKEWANTHRDALIATGSTLHLQLVRLEFMEILGSGGKESRNKALAFARETFPTLNTTPSAIKDLGELMGCMACAGLHVETHTPPSPYAHLYSPSLWETAADTVATDGYRAAQLPKNAPLYTATQAGVIAAPVIGKVAKNMANRKWSIGSASEAGRSGGSTQTTPNTNSNLNSNSDRAGAAIPPLEWLPVHVSLPVNLRFHSVFSCPVSREPSGPGNPPMLLQCGHVICRSSMLKLPRHAHKFKCPTCPTEQVESSAVVLHF